jgi:hypothetical protein
VDLLPLTTLLGFLLGLRHATDPDHVVAVATIVSRERSVRAAGGVGALWGIGHSLTILVAGGALVLLKVTVAPRVGLALEFGVAVMLVLLGVLNLRHGHRHDGAAVHAARPIAVGVVHGLAGTGAVAVALVPLIPSAGWALVYLVVFGLGTVAGMTLVTAAIAIPAALAAHRVRDVNGWLRVASGVASIAFGLFLAHRIGVVEGLFLGGAR